MDLFFKLWDWILELTSRLVTPLWGTLLQYIPLLFFGLIALVVAMVVRSWRRNADRNASRVPRRRSSGATPADVHLPDPSAWPIVGSAGLFMVFLWLVTGAQVLLVIGLVIAVVAVIGWYRDAGREYHGVASGGHHAELPAQAGTASYGEEVIPEGIHLPAPSAWPFFAPIGGFFIFLGLILSPVLIVGGLLMALIAIIGWYRDAGREYRDVEEGGHGPVERNPDRIYPKALNGVFITIAVVSILITSAPWLLSMLPQTTDAVAEGPATTTTPYVSAVGVMGFDQSKIYVTAGQPFTITFENKQAGVAHNVQIFSDAAKTQSFFTGEHITGPATIDYAVDALAAGEYPFICEIHPATMVGTVVVR